MQMAKLTVMRWIPDYSVISACTEDIRKIQRVDYVKCYYLA